MTEIDLEGAVTRWTFDLPFVSITVALALAYGIGVHRARRSGALWPRWRVAAFGLGLGSLAWVTCGLFAAYNHILFWPLAVQMTMLVTIVPVGLALGDPVGLVRAAWGCALEPQSRLIRGMLRTLAFPLVGPILAVVSQFAVLFSGYLHAALTHGSVMNLMYLNLLCVGCLVAVPFFGLEDLLPAWCTAPLRVLFAAVDGIIDAVPGIWTNTTATPMGRGYYAALRPSWCPTLLQDTHIGGGLMVVVAELLGIPMLAVLFVGWVRADRERARAWDAALDAESEVAR